MTGLAISSDVRSAFACCPGPTHSDRSLRSKATASYALSGPTAVKVIPDKLTPVPLGAADWLEGPLSAHLAHCGAFSAKVP